MGKYEEEISEEMNKGEEVGELEERERSQK